MGNRTLFDLVKSGIGSIGFKLFLWSVGMKQEQYWRTIYLQELRELKQEPPINNPDRRVGGGERMKDAILIMLSLIGSILVIPWVLKFAHWYAGLVFNF